MLFYGYSQSQYNHLAVSLHNSSLHVSVVFIDQTNYDELWMALGANLHDDRYVRANDIKGRVRYKFLNKKAFQ